MWSQIGVLSEDEVFNDTFSVNTLVRIDNSDPLSVSAAIFLLKSETFFFYRILTIKKLIPIQ